MATHEQLVAALNRPDLSSVETYEFILQVFRLRTTERKILLEVADRDQNNLMPYFEPRSKIARDKLLAEKHLFRFTTKLAGDWTEYLTLTESGHDIVRLLRAGA